ncbi:MAG: AmmeMemoRadiSam system protein B [bacterium]|nr:AmmeMemoRadiSam system protein B [bacterium]
MNRRPAVAGSFYPGIENVLRNELEQFITVSEEKKKVKGLISPHAGYIYSAGCAGKGFGLVEVPDTVIILGVNHRGMGMSFAVDYNDTWSTPLGDIAIDKDLAKRLGGDSDIFDLDPSAGMMEHSLEVQVPFIQHLNPNAKILPVTISSMSLEPLIAGGKEIAQLIKGRDDVLIVASTDMSHYVDAETAKREDQKAIDRILAMDPEGLLNTVRCERISMCGVAPTTMMLVAAKELGATTSEVVQYTNSGEASGDFSQVVGYLSMIVY